MNFKAYHNQRNNVDRVKFDLILLAIAIFRLILSRELFDICQVIHLLNFVFDKYVDK